jgi:hypothetical protein
MGKINHKLKNVERYLVNTWQENFQQNCIDLILCKHINSSLANSELGEYVDKEMKLRKELYSEIFNIKVHVGTWNLGGRPPPTDLSSSVNIKEWLFLFKENFIPDIFVLGFQEIVDLNPHSVLLGNNSAIIRQWVDLILFNLNSLSQDDTTDYVHLASENLVGLHIAVFVKKNLSPRVTELASTRVKLGFSGNLGNKGATLIRFKFDDTSMCFVNCHLESGMSQELIITRAMQLDTIMSNAFIK